MQQTLKPIAQIVFGLLLVCAFTACQPAAQTPALSGGEGSYPAPQQEQQVIEPVNVLYPDVQTGAEVSWPQAYGMLMNGEVSRVLQPNAEKFTLVLKDGRSLAALQPAPGDILQAIESCGEPCQTIEVKE